MSFFESQTTPLEPSTNPPSPDPLADYRTLKPDLQAIVDLLAVNGAPLSLTRIRSGLGLPNKARLDLAALERRGLVLNHSPGQGRPGNSYACPAALREPLARHLAAEGRFAAVAELARRAWPLGTQYWSAYANASADARFESIAQFIREVRIGLYLHDEDYAQRMWEQLERHRRSYWNDEWDRIRGLGPIYASLAAQPFDPDWFRTLPAGLQRATLPDLLRLLSLAWRLDDAAYRFLAEQCQALAILPPGLALAALLRGEPAPAAALEATPKSHPEGPAWAGLLALLRGDTDDAVKHFETALRLHRKRPGQRKGFTAGLAGVFHLLALAFRNRGQDLDQARTLLAQANTAGTAQPVHLLLARSLDLEGDRAGSLDTYRNTLRATLTAETDPWTVWIGLLLLHRYDASPASFAPYLPRLAELRTRADTLGYAWLATELGQLLARLDPLQAAGTEAAAHYRQRTGLTLLVDRVRYEAPWERVLNAVRNLVTPAEARAPDTPAAEPEFRLAWGVGKSYGHYTLEPREQKRSERGWTKGRAVSLKQLVENPTARPWLTEPDRRAIGHIAWDTYYDAYRLSEHGWLALVGHPRVFWLDSGLPLELVAAPPELRVLQTQAGQIRIEFWPQQAGDRTLVITPEGLHRLRLTELKPDHQRLAKIIGDGFDAPEAAQAQILEGLSAVSSLLPIHSDIGTVDSAGAESVEADACPRVQLAPDGDGLRVAVLVRPFGERGAYQEPGQGSAGLIAEIDGQRLQTQRDLKQEHHRVVQLIMACPSLEDDADPDQPFQWLKPDLESSLTLLTELGAAGEDLALVEWPQGEKFRLLGHATLGQMSVQLRQHRDWFGVEGELRLDNGEVIALRTLLDLLDAQPGRFLRLDGERFLALTEAFRKRLEDLRAFSELHGDGQRLHPLALPVLEEMAGEFGEFRADAAWRQRVEQLREAERLDPKLPTTFQAELRDYQRDGYVWLARLAAWGVGACLADDMGLGKTVQALALILSRAHEGPSLVIAPTSVGFNWHSEAARFAPTLNLKSLTTGDRQKTLDGLGPLDLLVCSYGLLQQEAVGDRLAKVRWRTLVLDEAQAIKNAATQRSKQAMALQADFKLVTTGTPLENHLGELWNLFRFINPGLLGSLERFNRRFAVPIERDQDRDARQRLKRLIQPFLLRRTKAQVLDELPPRTEIELRVELGEQEAAFYEALRRKLLEELEEGPGPAEDQRFRVLAAITKLRRACCHPGLIAPELGLSSSKLAALGEVLDELLANRHKALVFSQFVDHLSLVRAYLDERGVSYQYLDGQTPAPERKKRVEAFQAGEGDVFLISLKAGGTGLNLTAADYVLHLDPWWNPAVEDQASDRAHRIGQTRPVTIYRLVAKGTIEEKIVSLHRHKRELADSLLEGGELSGKIGAEELLALMREPA